VFRGRLPGTLCRRRPERQSPAPVRTVLPCVLGLPSRIWLRLCHRWRSRLRSALEYRLLSRHRCEWRVLAGLLPCLSSCVWRVLFHKWRVLSRINFNNEVMGLNIGTSFEKKEEKEARKGLGKRSLRFFYNSRFICWRISFLTATSSAKFFFALSIVMILDF